MKRDKPVRCCCPWRQVESIGLTGADIAICHEAAFGTCVETLDLERRRMGRNRVKEAETRSDK
jgi:hypothetical protein